MRWRVQLRINSIRVMFANFAKIGRAAGASPIWQKLFIIQIKQEEGQCRWSG